MLPSVLAQYLEEELQSAIVRSTPVPGGSIHRSLHLVTADRRQLFLKYNKSALAAEMFRTESLGLALLGASGVIGVPKVCRQTALADGWALLLLDYIAPGYRNRMFWEAFGRGLAMLHGNTSAQFGFSHDNFIGALPQSNRRHDSWAAFYAEERLLPQGKSACDAGLLDAAYFSRLESLCKRLGVICPDEPPALVHGDLWSGNFLCGPEGKPYLIDPAACFAHREMDLAMSRLFGGFDAAFYESYSANYPLEPGFEQRLQVYQLYYVLVHVNLFGGGYVEQAKEILRRF